MQKTQQKTRNLHSPNLDTILMVEKCLKETDESIITVAQLKRELPKKVNHNTLITILGYLETSRKIVVTLKGITWIQNDNPNLRRIVMTGREV